MKPKNQRLLLVVAAIVAVLLAVLLAMWGLRERAAYFYTPADIAAGKAEQGRAVRLGGMVEQGSIQRLPDGVTIRRDPVTVDFERLIRRDTLVQRPPENLDSSLATLGWADEALGLLNRALPF